MADVLPRETSPAAKSEEKRMFSQAISFLVTNKQRTLCITRTLLVALSLACLEMSFVVKGAGAVILLFRLEYKTSAICHNVNTQKVKIARRDRPHILAYILTLLH